MPVNTRTRAYQIKAFGLDQIEEAAVELSPLGPNDVLVRMHACSLNYRDYMVAKGIYNPKQKLPLVPLSDGAGEVIEIGSSVTQFKTGDRVTPIFMQRWLSGELNADASKSALGAALSGVLQREAIFNENGLLKIPAHLSYEEAATLPCAAVTAWNALFEQGKIHPGQTVLTLGTGGVSIFALQFAKAAGAKVLITSSSNEKLQRAKSLGADITINYKEDADWDSAVLKEIPEGVDHVIEVGGAGTLDKSIRCSKLGGHVSLIGVLASGQFDPRPLLMKSMRLQGIFVGSREMFLHMNRAISAHNIKPVIDRTFKASEIGKALEHMAGANHFGKIVLRFE